MAFALHLSVDGSATYSSSGKFLVDAAVGGSHEALKAGWTAGAGLEAAFTDNLTARIEYLFIDLQNGVCNQGAQCGFPAPGVPSNDTVKFSTSVIRFGLDYKFR